MNTGGVGEWKSGWVDWRDGWMEGLYGWVDGGIGRVGGQVDGRMAKLFALFIFYINVITLCYV